MCFINLHIFQPATKLTPGLKTYKLSWEHWQFGRSPSIGSHYTSIPPKVRFMRVCWKGPPVVSSNIYGEVWFDATNDWFLGSTHIIYDSAGVTSVLLHLLPVKITGRASLSYCGYSDALFCVGWMGVSCEKVMNVIWKLGNVNQVYITDACIPCFKNCSMYCCSWVVSVFFLGLQYKDS